MIQILLDDFDQFRDLIEWNDYQGKKELIVELHQFLDKNVITEDEGVNILKFIVLVGPDKELIKLTVLPMLNHISCANFRQDIYDNILNHPKCDELVRPFLFGVLKD